MITNFISSILKILDEEKFQPNLTLKIQKLNFCIFLTFYSHVLWKYFRKYLYGSFRLFVTQNPTPKQIKKKSFLVKIVDFFFHLPVLWRKTLHERKIPPTSCFFFFFVFNCTHIAPFFFLISTPQFQEVAPPRNDVINFANISFSPRGASDRARGKRTRKLQPFTA